QLQKSRLGDGYLDRVHSVHLVALGVPHQIVHAIRLDIASGIGGAGEKNGIAGFGFPLELEAVPGEFTGLFSQLSSFPGFTVIHGYFHTSHGTHTGPCEALDGVATSADAATWLNRCDEGLHGHFAYRANNLFILI